MCKNSYRIVVMLVVFSRLEAMNASRDRGSVIEGKLLLSSLNSLNSSDGVLRIRVGPFSPLNPIFVYAIPMSRIIPLLLSYRARKRSIDSIIKVLVTTASDCDYELSKARVWVAEVFN